MITSDLFEQLEILKDALIKIAALTDELANARLAATGSYFLFDEPSAVQTARDALREIGDLPPMS